ncbi:MAG: hypothetical protein MR412_03305 [Firmicutes bacterium]|nr:hypothetical protein [Bacillota bacterium]MDY5676843.1 hypothetical protein [Eubacteriales bacterium]
MSFFSGNRQGCNPGPITGNPLQGLCEKACIQTRKVFDACMKQIQMDGTQVILTNQQPQNPTAPLTFVGCTTLTENVTITNLVVDRFEDKPCFARVTGNVSVPITVNYTDNNSTAGSGTGIVTIPIDVVLYVPQPSIIPYQVTAFANAICSGGRFVEGSTFAIDPCITLIIRVVVDAELLIPTYGYCQIPPCQDYTQDVCSGYFDLPLYPAQQPVNPPTQININ